MAARPIRTFSDAELRRQVEVALARSALCLDRNKQDHALAYRTLAAALTQALQERDDAQQAPQELKELRRVLARVTQERDDARTELRIVQAIPPQVLELTPAAAVPKRSWWRR